MVVFGGQDGTVLTNEVWALSLAEPPAWSLLDPDGPIPWPRAYHAAVADPARDRMLVYGGCCDPFRGDVWALSFTPGPPDEPPPPPPPPEALALAARPNPFSGETVVRYALPVAGRVDLTVFDVAGRLVRRLAGEWQTADVHSIVWGGRDRDGRAAPAGVYFLRLSAAGTSRTLRVVHLD
jgi:hypothetical protein